MQRTIKTDRYKIRPNPRSKGAHVELEIRRYQRVWELDGEPMETAGEVIANIGLILEHLDREASR